MITGEYVERFKVRIHGAEFWVLLDKDGNGPVAPLHHCRADGSLNYMLCFSSETYAHVYGGTVNRYGKQIAKLSELERV